MSSNEKSLADTVSQQWGEYSKMFKPSAFAWELPQRIEIPAADFMAMQVQSPQEMFDALQVRMRMEGHDITKEHKISIELDPSAGIITVRAMRP